ncbi:Oidioi.mRNA.OKI2018_I69.chr1.g126.t1.cds [Oikopleura dioica]|uniref:Oidioi.mRNA.OKI2018_I69.chr1.g126.t1.cds n=1 Tax=Oikopleura dioica TaxID=34765 RepID=A0ABN7SMQ5_OIKDI|nr:Oidioi.mRNA.OKI2018_I69.chr1.g126.t1.cds [Oikopleura dioica]
MKLSGSRILLFLAGYSAGTRIDLQSRFQRPPRSLVEQKNGCKCPVEPRPQYHLQGQWFLNLRTCDPNGKLFIRSGRSSPRSKECIPTQFGYENHPSGKSNDQILVITKCGCA